MLISVTMKIKDLVLGCTVEVCVQGNYSHPPSYILKTRGVTMSQSARRRHAIVVFCALAGMLLFSSRSRADNVVFNSPTGDLGSSTNTYTLDGVNVVVTAFNGGDLFGKDSGIGEMGVGNTIDPTGQHEITATGTPQDFIQVDLSNLIAAGFTNFDFAMNSVTLTDAWQVTACSTAGVSGSGPCPANSDTVTGTDQLDHSAPGNVSATNHFLDFSANSGNVLLELISATPPSSVPEPSSFMLLLAGVLATLVLFKRRPV